MKSYLGNYTAENGKVVYLGNKFLKPLPNVLSKKYKPAQTDSLLKNLVDQKHYYHLHNIDNTIFNSTVDYFRIIGASWCNLPLTTKMISSPGEIYAGQKLNYTTDALPVTLDWFGNGKIFLSESSQFYLELRLIIEHLQQVYSIYNSFRKECADFSHLSEFQHIEYEGKVGFDKNIDIFLGLLRHITDNVVKKNQGDLLYYLTPEEIEGLNTSFERDSIEKITFNDAMDLLFINLKDKKYKIKSLKNFCAYEEVALTRIVGKHCLVVEYPLEEISFYHDMSFIDKDGNKYAKNADLILYGYREVVGSGQRITNPRAISEKAKFFNLPKRDYEPYIQLRSFPHYKTTSGFGLGWQRYTQWLLKMPYIWDMSHVPRGEHIPCP